MAESPISLVWFPECRLEQVPSIFVDNDICSDRISKRNQNPSTKPTNERCLTNHRAASKSSKFSERHRPNPLRRSPASEPQKESLFVVLDARLFPKFEILLKIEC